MFAGFVFSAEEKKQVEEKHATEVDGETTHLEAGHFKEILGIGHPVVGFQHQEGETDVEKVEANAQQVVGGFGNFHTTTENVGHEYHGVAKQGTGYVPGKEQGQR